MGDFFARQELARRRTRWLVLLFLAAVAAIVGAVALLMYLLFAGDLPPGELRALLGGSALATLLVIAVASLVKIASLRSGGPAVALSVGAVPVDPTTQDPRLRRLINTVEEMAIASGSPVPAIFVLEGEEGINAFAAGYGPGDAAVAVTRGALERLTRDELQGVIAHEFSHIAHGDMRLNVRLIGLLAGILAVAAIGRAMVRGASRSSGSGRRNGGNAFLVLVIGASLWLIGSIGQFFGRLIKAAVSRQREFLADASAVQFTRQPAGILGALVKIAAAPRQARLQDGGAEELSHMLFGDGFGLRGLFATHPPLESRIRAIDPRFDAERIAKLSAQLPAVGAAWDELPALGLAAAPAEAPAAEGSAQPRGTGIAPEQLRARVGQIDAPAIAEARRLLAQIPPALRQAARLRDEAPLVVLALIVARSDPGRRAEQLAAVAARLPGAAQRLEPLLEAVAMLHPLQHLPLATLALAPLRSLPRDRVVELLGLMDELIRSDERIELFEYCLARLAATKLADVLDPQGRPPFGRARLGERRESALALLSVLAAHGHEGEEAARRAFQAGARIAFGDEPVGYAPPADWIAALDRALPSLDELKPEAKELLLEAMAAIVAHDGRIAVVEAELLRTIAACLHLPIPPLAGGAEAA